MSAHRLIGFWLLIAAVQPALAQAPNQAPDSKGTYLGALFGPVPEALFDHLPNLPRGRGVLVTHVLPDSPADQAPLKRNDILIDYDGQKIRDCEHFARLIQADRPDRQVRLGVVRAGKEMTLDARLARGPALKISNTQRGYYNNLEQNLPKATAKGNGPAPVSVSALPLEKDRMRVTIEYYQDGTGRLRSVIAEGSGAEIDGEVQKLPDRERNLVRRALEQIRSLNSPRQQSQSPATKSAK